MYEAFQTEYIAPPTGKEGGQFAISRQSKRILARFNYFWTVMLSVKQWDILGADLWLADRKFTLQSC